MGKSGEAGISAQGIFGPVRNECEGEGVNFGRAEIHVTPLNKSITHCAEFFALPRFMSIVLLKMLNDER